MVGGIHTRKVEVGPALLWYLNTGQRDTRRYHEEALVGCQSDSRNKASTGENLHHTGLKSLASTNTDSYFFIYSDIYV